jgi:molybdenum cofactor cytidylyltransferase
MSTTASPQPGAARVVTAGYSRRFDADKRHAEFDDGRSLLGAIRALPCAVLDEVSVVLRPDEAPSDLALPATVQVIQDPASSQGMGHILAAGARRLQAVAIFLADMPLIRRDTLETLLACATPNSIVTPSCRSSRGHSVLFGRRFWPQLGELVEDRGARLIVERFPQALQVLELDDPSVVQNADTAEDCGGFSPRTRAR